MTGWRGTWFGKGLRLAPLLFLSVTVAGEHAARSEPDAASAAACKHLLGGADAAARARVEARRAISERTQPLREQGLDAIRVRADGREISPAQLMRNGLAGELMAEGKVNVLGLLNTIAKAWVEAFAATAEKHAQYLEPEAETRIPVIEFEAGDRRVRPIQENPEITRALWAAAWGAMKGVELAREIGKVGILGRQVQIYAPDQRFEKKKDPAKLLRTESFEGVWGRYSAELKARLEPVIEAEYRKVTRSGVDARPDIGMLYRTALPLMSAMVFELSQRFPLAPAEEMGTAGAGGKAYREIHAAFAELFGKSAEQNVVPDVQFRDGQVGVTLRERGLRGTYDPSIGSGVYELAAGGLANAHGPLLVLDHGAGTAHSNAVSWVQHIGKLASVMPEGFAFNSVAMDLALAMSGMDIRGFEPTMAYLAHRAEWLRKRYRLDEPVAQSAGGPVFRVAMQLGRSLGGQSTVAEALLHNQLDVYIANSFSDPFTIEPQVENVRRQFANRSIEGIVEGALQGAVEFSGGFREGLLRLRAEAGALRHFGANLLFLQGEADRDGGDEVVSNLFRFRDTYAPLGTVYVFPNPLKKYPDLKLDDLADHLMEAQHILFSTYPNLVTEGKPAEYVAAIRRRYPNVAEADLPKLQDQLREVIAVKFRYLDHLAEFTGSSHPVLERVQPRISAYREWYLEGLRKKSGKAFRTFFDAYLWTLKLSREQLAALPPFAPAVFGVSTENELSSAGRRTMEGRLRWVDDFFAYEKTRQLERMR